MGEIFQDYLYLITGKVGCNVLWIVLHKICVDRKSKIAATVGKSFNMFPMGK